MFIHCTNHPIIVYCIDWLDVQNHEHYYKIVVIISEKIQIIITIIIITFDVI